MRHRRMLISSIIIIAVGLCLWYLVGPIIMSFGLETGSYETGWWIFTQTHYYTYITPLFYVGLALALIGLLLVAVGVTLSVVFIVLELTSKEEVNR